MADNPNSEGRGEQTGPPHASVGWSQLSANQLAEVIEYHDRRYWRDNAPEIPDQLYDQLVTRLQLIEPDHPVLGRVGGGGADVGMGPSAGDKVVHLSPMLSLGKCYTETELLHWARDYPGQLLATPKVDGAACSIRYDVNGKLHIAATRGDGLRGESVGHQVRLIPNVPKQLPATVMAHYGTEVEVRGEVYMPLSAFAPVASLFANPRNVAAGALKAKEQGSVSASELRFFAYDLLGWPVDSETAKAALLRRIGFEPAPALACDRDNAERLFGQMQAQRDELDYETDGVVFKIDDIATQRRLGATGHHPRWAIAYKYQGDSGETNLLDVQWSLARTGTITPVAIVEPVELSGAMVSRATLHNLSNLERLALREGDRLLLTRRGGVIPHVEGNLGGGQVPLIRPQTCPSCGQPTVIRTSTRRVSGEDVVTRTLHCSAPGSCPMTLRGQLSHYTRVLEIDGFGEKILDQLVDRGLVRDAADLYRLRPVDLLMLERMGEKLAQRLCSNVQDRRSLPLTTFLVALGIDTLGRHAAELLASRWDMAGLRSANAAEFAAIHSLGETTAQRIASGLSERADLIDGLLEFVVVQGAEERSQGPLSGEVVVFTGKLEELNRRDAQQMVVRLGGAAGSSVTQETTILVVGGQGLEAPKPSSKIKRARKLIEAGQSLQLMSEAAFIQMTALSESNL